MTLPDVTTLGITAAAWNDIVHAVNALEMLGEVGYAEITANSSSFTTLADISGLSVTFTLTATRRVLLRASTLCRSTTVNDVIQAQIADGSNAQIVASGDAVVLVANRGPRAEYSQAVTLAAGTYTYKVRAQRVSGAGTCVIAAAATDKAYIQAVDITLG